MGANYERMLALQGRGASPSSSARSGSYRAGAFGLDVTIPQVDIARFQQAMKLLVEEMGQSREDAALHGAMSLASALRASTRIAPQFRKITTGEETKSRHGHSWKNPVWMRERFSTTGGRAEEFAGYRATGKASKWVLERAISRQEAKQKSRIGNRGLAKSAWFWFLSHMGKKGGGGVGAGMTGLPDAAEFVEFSQSHTPSVSTITMYNRLSYASLAFRTKGKLPDSAFARAAGIMEHYIDRQVQKYMRKYG